MRWGDTRVR